MNEEKKQQLIRFVDELIASYREEADTNIQERSCNITKDIEKLEIECEELSNEFLEILEDKNNE